MKKKNTFISNTKKSNDEVFFLSLKLQDKIRLSEEEKVEYKKFFFYFLQSVVQSVSFFYAVSNVSFQGKNQLSAELKDKEINTLREEWKSLQVRTTVNAQLQSVTCVFEAEVRPQYDFRKCFNLK